jgi:hypothetical protein
LKMALALDCFLLLQTLLSHQIVKTGQPKCHFEKKSRSNKSASVSYW